jgi:ribosomal protein S18 acetylase RimI-like enzyme
MFSFILWDLIQAGIKRIILWGGVQSSNAHALAFYRRLGFSVLGSFEYYGENLDMVLNLSGFKPDRFDINPSFP